jgi:hypothetical protein
VTNLFALDSILLVGEHEGDIGDALEVILVIQRYSDGTVHCSIYGELDVLQLKGLAASFGGLGIEAFSWPQEPVEGHNAEEDDVHVEGTKPGVLDIKGIEQGSEDGEIGRVDSSCWVVFLVKGSDK